MFKNNAYIWFLVFWMLVIPVAGIFAQYTGTGRNTGTDTPEEGTSVPGLPETGKNGSGTGLVIPAPNDKSGLLEKPVIQRYLVEDTLRKIKSGDDFWYADKKESRVVATGSDLSFLKWLSGKTARFLIWCILIGGLVFFIVFYLMNLEIGLFAPARRKMETEGQTEQPENIFEIDFETALAGSLVAADYRLAIRLLFLRLLKIMNEKKLIEYSTDKTNFDYLFHLNGTGLFNDFSVLIRNYEYAWYGKFRLNEQQYGIIEKKFSRFQQQINDLS